MKASRLFLVGIATLLVLIGAGLLAMLNPRVQTWAARRVLAAHPEVGATVGSVTAGLDRVEIKNLRIEMRGLVLTLPAIEAELPLISAALRHRVTVTRLVAKGWTLDLTKTASVGQIPALFRGAPTHRAFTTAEFSLLASAHATEPVPASVGQVLQGVFAQLSLPLDFAVDGVELEGETILPAARGHARLALTGGGLGAGREARFEFVATAALTSTAVSTLEAHATVTTAMDTPRSFSRLGVKVDATASGLRFPRGVQLTAAATAARSVNGEDYALTLATPEKQLVAVQASFPLTARKLTGTWKIDTRDGDLAPFTLGRVLPPFAAAGDGRFDSDATWTEVHVLGKMEAASENLAALRPEFGAFGPLRLSAEFDLTQFKDTTRVDRLSAAIRGDRPIATVESLQPLTYNPKTNELGATNPAQDLFSVVLQGVPLAWAGPFVKDLTITGGDLRGEYIATASNDGFSLRPKSALVANGVSVVQAGRPLLRAVNLSLTASGDYTPHGWQAVVSPLLVRSGQATLLTLEAKAGQLAGAGQPVKITGKYSANLPALLAQPAAGGAARLARGDAAGDFSASLGVKQEIQATLALTNLETDPKVTTEKLPAISTEVRADIAAGGQITVNVPVVVERDGRKSDLSLIGTLTPDANGLAVAMRVSSTHLVVDDVKMLAAPLAPSPAPLSGPITRPSPAIAREPAPPWAGLTGQIALALKEVIYSGTFQASDVTGTLRLDAGSLKFEGIRAGFGSGSDAKISGAVTFDANAAAPYALSADLAVTEFDPAPLFKAFNPGQPATVEGKFNVTSKLSGQAPRLDDLTAATHGDFELSSKGGVFRGLPVSVSAKNETIGRVASLLAIGGSALDALKGRKDDSEITSTAKAVAEVSKMLAAIPYDQLSVALSRDASLNTVLKDFTLISPEMRLTGAGQVTHQTGTSLLEEALAMEFKLRARGHTGDLLKYLGKLDSQPDELGYAACTLPLKVGGTFGKPDTSELNNALASLALEKSGVKDKASDLLNKLFGGK